MRAAHRERVARISGPSRRRIRASLQSALKHTLLLCRRVCHVPCSVLCLTTVPSPSVWAVRSFSSSLEEVLSSFVPPEPSVKQNVGVHITWEEWAEPGGLDSTTLCGCQRLEQRKSTKRANSRSHLHHTPSKRRSCLPLAKRFGECRSPAPRSHSSPRTAMCIPSSFFSHSMSHYSTSFG